MQQEHPKVFISHDTDDKDRFVRGFAQRLRSRGVDAWVDEWELQVGDSLVDRIFEEGIGEALALIVVLSNESVKSKWVREELNAGFVQRITKQTRLIPVIIDKDCPIPVALQSTLYIRIEDLSAYDAELARIVAAIYGMSDKPVLGAAPGYTQAAMQSIPTLTATDNIVLKLSCEHAIRRGDLLVSATDIRPHAESLNILDEEVADAIRILHDRGFIEGYWTGSQIEHFQITLSGFHQYAQAYIANLDEMLRSVIACIVNEGMTHSAAIQEATQQPRVMIEYALDLFQNQGWLKASGALGGDVAIVDVSPELKRQLMR